MSVDNAMSVESEIRSFLASGSGAAALVGLSDHDSLLAAGIVDSVAMVDLIAHLEEHYDLVVAEEDMVPENFDTIAAMAAYVARQGCLRGEPRGTGT